MLTLFAVAACPDASSAREPGVGNNYQPGLTLGIPTGAAPPPGLYLWNGLTHSSSHIVDAGGNRTGDTLSASAFSVQAVYVPGWQFLGASYSAFLVQPLVQLRTNIAGVSKTINGIANTVWSPLNLSWNLGGGWFGSVGFSFYGPNGYITGANGTGGIGAPFWTFEPSVALSYLGEEWNLTIHALYNINTANPYDSYRSGDQLFVDLTATKKFGKLEIGPVAYFAAQTRSDSDPNGIYAPLAALGVAGIYSKPRVFAVGALAGYDFGPAKLLVYATDEVYARDAAQGWKIWGYLSFRIWGPERASITPLITK